jgi:hypothetical protein
MGSAVALLGFAGAANASATVDLVWIDVSVTNTAGKTICLLAKQRNCPVDPRSINAGASISSLAVTDNITLAVILTAGPNGAAGGGVSVDYSAADAALAVAGFQAMITTYPMFYLPLQLGTTTDTGSFIDNINAAASDTLATGIGLPAGGTAYLGTVSFHQDVLVNGTFEIKVGDNGPGGTDGLLDGNFQSIVPTFNNAWLINVPEPGALSLLVMGVGGMLLAGRGRRS